MTTIDHPSDVASAAASGASATERFHADKSPYAAVKDTPPERVDLLAREVLAAVHDTIRRHRVTYDEYNALKAWLIDVGQHGEWPLFLDVWVEHVVEDVATDHRAGNKGSIEGPYYVPGSPGTGRQGHDPDAGRRAGHTTGLARSHHRRPTAHRCRARSNSGTPTMTATTHSSHRGSRTGTYGAASPPDQTVPSKSPRFARRRTRFRPTDPAES